MPKFTNQRPPSIGSSTKAGQTEKQSRTSPSEDGKPKFSSLRSSPLTTAQKKLFETTSNNRVLREGRDENMFSMASTSAPPPPIPEGSSVSDISKPSREIESDDVRDYGVNSNERQKKHEKQNLPQVSPPKRGKNINLSRHKEDEIRSLSLPANDDQTALRNYIRMIQPRQQVVYDAYGNEIGYNEGLPHKRNPILASAIERYINLSKFFGVENPTSEDFEHRVTGSQTKKALTNAKSGVSKVDTKSVGDNDDDLSAPLASTAKTEVAMSSSVFGPTVTSVGSYGLSEDGLDDNSPASAETKKNNWERGQQNPRLSPERSATLFGLTAHDMMLLTGDKGNRDSTCVAKNGEYVSLGANGRLSQSAPSFSDPREGDKLVRSHTFSNIGQTRIPQIAYPSASATIPASESGLFESSKSSSWLERAFGAHMATHSNPHHGKTLRRCVEKRSRFERIFGKSQKV